MVGKTIILFFIQKEFFAGIPFLDTLNMIGGIVISDAGAVDGEIIFLVTDILAVDRVEITFAE
jgi:hypothetical protein